MGPGGVCGGIVIPGIGPAGGEVLTGLGAGPGLVVSLASVS